LWLGLSVYFLSHVLTAQWMFAKLGVLRTWLDQFHTLFESVSLVAMARLVATLPRDSCDFNQVVIRQWMRNPGYVDVINPCIERCVYNVDEVRTTVKTYQFLRRDKLFTTTVVIGFSTLFLSVIRWICVRMKTEAGKTIAFKLKDIEIHKRDHHGSTTCRWDEDRWWTNLKKDDSIEKWVFSNLTVIGWFNHTLKT
jgi:hypothetical protein